MTTNEMVTRKQAEAVLALVERKYRTYLKTFPYTPGRGFDFDTMVDVPDSDRPQIREWEDDNGGRQLAIVWESNAPYEWALSPLTEAHVDEELVALASEFSTSPGVVEDVATIQGAKGSMPEGVRAEAAMSFVLVLYKEV